jgi:glucose dehydrogenase
MQTLEFHTVIIGSGFAGRTVASHLPEGSYLILERGEDRSHGETIKRYQAARDRGLRDFDAEAEAFASDRPWNRLDRLSPFCYSRFAMVRGGASNWWGGKSSRFSEAVFASEEGLPWALSSEEMAPWYRAAEARLNIAGDPLLGPSREAASIEGAALWRTAFSPFLQPSGLYAVAVGKDPARGAETGQGLCRGRGHCAVCKEDAKARPDNRFAPMNILHEAYVLEIEFSGDRATGVVFYDGRQLLRVACERVVVAANGVETPRLLARSTLPGGVEAASLGRFCQDHAHLEIDCWIPKPLPHGAVGALSHVQVQELSRMYSTPIGSIETSALALTHGPGHAALAQALQPRWALEGGAAAVRRGLAGTFKIFVELETLSQIDARVDLESEVPALHDDGYRQLIPHFERITDDMCSTLARQGVRVLGTQRYFREGYGGHHFVGTTNWSRSAFNMMEDDGRLGGTANVYIAGSSVIPRAGGVAPTLTLVALAERLGHHLAGA